MRICWVLATMDDLLLLVDERNSHSLYLLFHQSRSSCVSGEWNIMVQAHVLQQETGIIRGSSKAREVGEVQKIDSGCRRGGTLP
jgi:hypothetical protein